MQESKLRVGVLGAGRWAESAHIPGWLRDPRCEVVALCDVQGERSREFAQHFGIPEATDDWQALAEFGRSKEEWLKTFLALPNGIPSHGTFWRVFRVLDADKLAACFLSWMGSASELIGGQVIAIDGKMLRHSHDRGSGQAAIYMVSAWASANRLILAQSKVAEKSNEITAIPELLRVLDIAGCIVTIDAIGCQTEITQ